MAYIHEFPHPTFIVHFNPEDGRPFTMATLQRALSLQAHALELDLYRADSDLRCGEGSNAGITLQEAFDALLSAKGRSSSMYGDDLQFFLVLDPKDTDDRSVDLLWSILQNYKLRLGPHLSTSATSDHPAHGMTLVLTGEKALYDRYKGVAFNELLVLEESDRRQQQPPLVNVSTGAGPFRWWESIAHEDEHGQVNVLHSRGFNLRTYAAETGLDDLALQFATGVDSVNCQVQSFVAFRSEIRSQQPRGTSPSLALRGGMGLLAWRGTDYLYMAFSKAEITFKRQLNLSFFLQEKPLAKTPGAAVAPDGRFIIVYEGTDAERLWYVSGRFTQPDRLITFDGHERPLTRPDGSRRGHNPKVAIAPDGRVIIVYEGTDAQRLWYVSGHLDPTGTLVGDEFELTQGNSRRGSTPSIAIAGSSVIVAYRGTGDDKIWYVSGSINAANGQIIGQEFQLMPGQAGRGFTPAVAIADDGRVLMVYEGTTAQNLWYVTGYVSNRQIVGREFQLTVVDSIRGTQPTVAIDSSGHVVILYVGTGDNKLWYVKGQFTSSGWLTVPEEFLLDMSLPGPT